PAPAPAEAPTPAPTSAAPAATPAAPPERKPHGLIDDQAKRLAEFFNGEVVDLQDPLPELSDDQAAA
ncbi:MAG: DNA polymerase III subunit gamma/tau, partial [Vulcanococcus sp.]